jgi:hypothetical protein
MTEQNQGPSFLQKAKNFANFSWEIVNYINQKGPDSLTVPDDVYERRLSICQECKRYDSNKKQCLECGCYIPAKAKIILDSCPLDKWTADRDSWDLKLEEISKKLDSTSESL